MLKKARIGRTNTHKTHTYTEQKLQNKIQQKKKNKNAEKQK